MLKLNKDYSDYVDMDDVNYPEGKAINASSSESFDGTPVLDDFLNDMNASHIAMYKKAYGNTDGINGQADTQNESQFAEAVAKYTDDTVKAHAYERGLANGVHGATSEPVAGQIASRDENGNMEAGSAIKNKDVINKEYLTNVIDNLMQNKVYPIGKSFFTENPADPATYLGFGTWVRIKGKFLWALDDEEKVGVTGGSKTVTLTEQQIPSHTHKVTASGTIAVKTNPTFTGSAVTSGGSTASISSATATSGGAWSMYARSTEGSRTIYNASGLVEENASDSYNALRSTSNAKRDILRHAGHTHSVSISQNNHSHSVTASGTISGGAYTFTGTEVTSVGTGGSQSHDNMPPYEGYYCWKRIA